MKIHEIKSIGNDKIRIDLAKYDTDLVIRIDDNEIDIHTVGKPFDIRAQAVNNIIIKLDK